MSDAPAYGLWSLVLLNSLMFIMFGFLPQWPTLITLVMFPVLLVVYARLAKSEERDSVAEFGAAYEEYRKQVPAFIPAFGRHELQSGYQ
jgi:methanethiol S-methyltransferase